ncbi:hypothetical protein BDV96DRAFT_674686 [Lophiotrema nucula]|uniref:Uncharacterized protein n=1 Tax=Lophiotrema nucula TaxID=690887 RepID=A0A6A5ZMH0_9PLEO|nr:hypothetical protein BDV96DRAFT_674686 [Lophiotrema nucula]
MTPVHCVVTEETFQEHNYALLGYGPPPGVILPPSGHLSFQMMRLQTTYQRPSSCDWASQIARSSTNIDIMNIWSNEPWVNYATDQNGVLFFYGWRESGIGSTLTEFEFVGLHNDLVANYSTRELVALMDWLRSFEGLATLRLEFAENCTLEKDFWEKFYEAVPDVLMRHSDTLTVLTMWIRKSYYPLAHLNMIACHCPNLEEPCHVDQPLTEIIPA